MNDKKEMIDQIIRNTNLKEKVDAAFSEIEDQTKEKLMAELENAMRDKLQKELEKKAEKLKKKARKCLLKALISTALVFCAGFLILNHDKLIPSKKIK